MSAHRLIASSTVSDASVASIQFTSIPGNYTDLVLRLSTRNTGSSIAHFADYSINGITPTGRSLYADTSVYSTTGQYGHIDTSDTATTNTFSNSEIYIFDYTSSNSKHFNLSGVSENNGTICYRVLSIGSAATTSAVTSITITPQSGGYKQYSTAYLYGIKNT